jgi:hypothetical protein
MNYKYIQIFRVYGISTPTEEKVFSLIQDDTLNIKAITSSNIDDYCAEIDRKNAVGSLILGGPWGKDNNEIDKAIKENIDKIRERRKTQLCSDAAILLEVEGQIDNQLDGQKREFDDFTVCFDELKAVDVKKMVTASTHAKNLMLCALFLATSHPIEIRKLTEGVYLIDHNKKVHYSYSLSMSAKCFSSEIFDNKLATRTDSYFKELKKSKSLDKVFRLLSQALDESNDIFRSFIFSWTALEIFINKIFNEYEKKFLDDLVKSSSLKTTHVYLERIADVMKDKYSLKDKFVVISSFLADDEAEKFLEEFKKIKKIRDQIIHGEEINENTLPVHGIIKIVKAYLKKHIG